MQVSMSFKIIDTVCNFVFWHRQIIKLEPCHIVYILQQNKTLLFFTQFQTPNSLANSVYRDTVAILFFTFSHQYNLTK